MTEGHVWDVGLFEVRTGQIEGVGGGGVRGLVGHVKVVGLSREGLSLEVERVLVKEFVDKLEGEVGAEGREVRERNGEVGREGWKSEVECWCDVLRSARFLDIKVKK